MKKLALLFLLITALSGCSIDDNNQNKYTYEVLAIDSYTVPANFKLGNTYEIKLKYQRPTSCHLYHGIYYSKDLNVRTIAIQSAVQTGQICEQSLPPLSDASFNFYVTSTGSYIFKFYKGKDTAGKDIFEEVEIPVVD